MDIYDMMKQGKTQEEIFAAFKQESKNARETIAKEEAAAREAEAKAKESEAKSALLDEARSHLINAILAYSQAFAPDIDYTDEEIAELETMLKDSEAEIEAMFHMAKTTANLFDAFGNKSDKSKKNDKNLKIAVNLDQAAMDKAIEKFLKDLL